MYRNSKIILFFMAAAALCACNPTKTPSLADFNPPNIDLPFKEEIIKYDIFNVNPTQGGSFETRRGTKVTFPSDAFVFEDGSKVTEPVQIEFREYHNASEILVSGIRMTATCETGEVLPFESAGMFDISGKCGDKKIEIAEGKSAEIILANRKSDADFNFYRLDEKGGWVEIKKNLPVQDNPISEEIKAAAEKPTPTKPTAPEKFDNNSFVFDLDMDVSSYPELKELYGIMWQYDGAKGAKTDPGSNKKITETDWISSEITRNGDAKYTLWFRSKKDHISIPVKPVISGKNYAAAKKRYDDKMNSYKAAVDAKEAAIKAISESGEYSRQLAISGFGIYNCDRFYRMPQVQTIPNPQFTLNRKPLPAGTTLYHLVKDDVVIQIYNPGMPFKYSKSEKNRIVAILPDKTVAALSNSDFQFITSDPNQSTVNVNLKQMPLGKITPEEFSKVISSI